MKFFNKITLIIIGLSLLTLVVSLKNPVLNRKDNPLPAVDVNGNPVVTSESKKSSVSLKFNI